MAEAIVAPRGVRCVVLDVYDTVAGLGPVIERDLVRHGKTSEQFAAHMGHIAALADLGHADWPFASYQREYNRFLGVSPHDDSLHLIPRLTPIAPMHDLMRRLLECEIPVGLLTNVSYGALRPTISQGAVPTLDYIAIIESCKCRMAKPNRDLFADAHEIIAGRFPSHLQPLYPQEVLFVDDSERNVAAARSFGWQAERFDPADPVNSVGRITVAHLSSAVAV